MLGEIKNMRYLQLGKHVEASGGEATETISLDLLPQDRVFLWTRFVALTNDGHKRRIRIYVQVGSSEHTLKQRTVTNTLDSVEVNCSLPLPGDVRISADYFNVDTGASLELYAYGYEVDPDTLV